MKDQTMGALERAANDGPLDAVKRGASAPPMPRSARGSWRAPLLLWTLPALCSWLVACQGAPQATGDGQPPAAVSEAPSTTRWGREYFPNVPLVTDEGKSVRFFDDLIAGKIVVINFIFTTCTRSCPLETARLMKVQQLLGDRIGRDVFMYSITIDPENDTPEVLKAYKERFGVRAGWQFLTGRLDDITLLRKKLGLLGEVVQNDAKDHNLSLIIGNQSTGRWMKRSPFENPVYLAEQIGHWLSNWKAPEVARNDYRDAPEARHTTVGETLFRTRCAACHSVGGVDSDGLALGLLVGPDLLGVTRRRDTSWLSRWLAEPDRMLAEGDPTATALFEQYRRLPMPNLKLGPSEIAAVTEYLEAEAVRFGAPPAPSAAHNVPASLDMQP